MTHKPDAKRLHTQLANMMALEIAIEERLKELLPQVSDHAEATALLQGFQALSQKQRRALQERLKRLAGNELPSSAPVALYTATRPPEAVEFPVSSSLEQIYTLYNQALVGYAMLGSLSTRALDSWVIVDEGSSAHLALEHMQNYAGAIQEAARLINDVVLWELDQDGVECQCICPSCAVGICLCSVAWRQFLSDAWTEAGPIAGEKGISVQQPKLDSAAIQAGLARGDVVLAAGGQELESFGDLQRVVRDSRPGEEIWLRVRRESGKVEDVAIVHP